MTYSPVTLVEPSLKPLASRIDFMSLFISIEPQIIALIVRRVESSGMPMYS